MRDLLLMGVEVIVGIFELWLCYQFMYATILHKEEVGCKGEILIWGNIIILGILLAINRNILFFSSTMFLFCIIVTGFCVWIVSRKDFLLILGMCTMFFSLLSLVDFLGAFISMLFLKESFGIMVYQEPSLWQIGIFLCVRVIGQPFLFSS